MEFQIALNSKLFVTLRMLSEAAQGISGRGDRNLLIIKQTYSVRLWKYFGRKQVLTTLSSLFGGNKGTSRNSSGRFVSEPVFVAPRSFFKRLPPGDQVVQEIRHDHSGVYIHRQLPWKRK